MVVESRYLSDFDPIALASVVLICDVIDFGGGREGEELWVSDPHRTLHKPQGENFRSQMRMKLCLVVTLIGIYIQHVGTANILGLLPMPSPSHHIWNRSLMLALAERGHNITVFTPDSEKKPRPNYKQIIIEDMYEDNMNFTEFGDLNVYQGVIQLFAISYDLSAQVLSSKAAKKLSSLANTEKFDLIIADITGLECVQGYIHKFGSPPVIGITAYSHPVWTSYATGNPHNPAYFPEITLPFSNRMTFIKRLQNFMLHVFTIISRNYYYMDRSDKQSRTYFGDEMPYVGSYETNMSIIMVNTHFSFDHPQPHVPAIIPVGGLHLKPAQDLPQVSITAYSHPVWTSYATGNPHNPAYFPEITLPFSNRMTFIKRLQNFMLHVFTIISRNYYYMDRSDKQSRTYFGDEMPYVGSYETNMSIIMVNTHFSFDHPQPHVPAIIPVGGLHLKPAQDLPQDLKKLMDEAENGFIFFSLGSNIRSDTLSEEKRKVFLKAFSSLPCKVFWKWESDHLPGQPSNVEVRKWLPQNDILGHPNIRLFITHAGLLSTQEAIYHGVPILGVPFFADQYTNINKAKDHGFGEKVDFATFTTEILLAKIQKILQNSSYKENAERISRLFKDQPETPLERAIFWTEYVLRNNGAHHLRSSSVDMPWYQYMLLDVIAVLGTGVILVLLLLYKLLSDVFRQANKITKKKQH
uniref:UDP-glycosyltransferases domain-containing protein n=1 Tax=Timema genevievae TaxID=629358 RepID=A0A7R9K1N1_TIMGE|nr:unnamed protein product [Timema genevievae]